MNYQFLYTLLFSLITINANSQTGNWLWGRYGANGKGEATAVTTDLNGNVIVVGYIQVGSIIFAPYTLPAAELNGIFIVKYDANGNVMWANSADGISADEAWDVTADKDGNIYMVGGFGSPSIIFGNDTLFRNGGGSDSYVVKYDSLGNVIWALNPVSIGYDYSFSIAVDRDDNIYLTGIYSSSTITFGSLTINNPVPGNQQVYVVKIDSLGNALWLKTFGGSGLDYSLGIVADSVKNIYVTGYSNSPTIYFSQDTIVNSFPMENIYLIKYDSTGNEVWGKGYGSSGHDRGTGVDVDISGNIYVVGFFDSPSITFDSFSLYNYGYNDVFIFKSSPNGNVIWAKSGQGSGNDQAWSICTDQYSYIYLYGGFGYQQIDTLSFGTTQIYSPNNSVDPLFLAEFDSAGNILCFTTLPTGGILASGIESDFNGNIFIAGGANITPLIIGNDTLNGNLGSYVFTSKWSCKNISEVFTDNRSEVYLNVFPNPFSNFVSVKTNDNNQSQIIIYDILLNRLIEQSFVNETSIITTQLSNGIYIYELRKNNSETKVGIIIKQ